MRAKEPKIAEFWGSKTFPLKAHLLNQRRSRAKQMRLKILSIGPRWQLAKLKAPCLEPVIGIWITWYFRRYRVVYVLYKGEYRESQGIIPAKGRSTRPIWPTGISSKVVGNLQFNDALPHPKPTIPPLIEIPVPPKGCSFAWARAVNQRPFQTLYCFGYMDYLVSYPCVVATYRVK